METRHLNQPESQKSIREIAQMAMEYQSDQYDWNFIEDEMFLNFEYGRGIYISEFNQLVNLIKPERIKINNALLN